MFSLRVYERYDIAKRDRASLFCAEIVPFSNCVQLTPKKMICLT